MEVQKHAESRPPHAPVAHVSLGPEAKKISDKSGWVVGRSHKGRSIDALVFFFIGVSWDLPCWCDDLLEKHRKAQLFFPPCTYPVEYDFMLRDWSTSKKIDFGSSVIPALHRGAFGGRVERVASGEVPVKFEVGQYR